jgi:hypothetical protein
VVGGDQRHHRYDHRQRPGHGVVVCRVSGGISTNRAAVVLRRADSNRCLDDPAWNHVNGTQMQIWGFNGGPNQKWNRG